MQNYNPDTCATSQHFGDNANPSYQQGGLKGHTGWDVVCGWHTPIHAPFDMAVYKVLTEEDPSRDGSGFTGVFGIVENGIECFELLIGHCDPCVAEGQAVKKGDVIGYEANHGLVFGPHGQVTLAQQAAGVQDGHHRHIQKRPVLKVQHTQFGQVYLDCYSDLPAGTLYRDAAGNYYQIWDYKNGYNGCVDSLASVFQRDLTVGSTAYDVWVLQNILRAEGCGTFAPTGYFGSLTLAAVKRLQAKWNIDPDAGYFGPKTRAAVIERYPL
jgi:hypothetical protein